jgi:mannuronan 5-epimerase
MVILITISYDYSILKPKRLNQQYHLSTIVLVIMTLSFPINGIFAQETNQQSAVDCISYSIEGERNQISISCSENVTLSDINNAIQNPHLLKKEDNNT